MNLNRKPQPGITSVESFNLQKPEKFILDNGIPVYTIDSGTEDVVKIELVFRAGSWYQPQSMIAVSANALMKEGTLHFSSDEISEKLDFYGAFLETNSEKDNAVITLYSLNKHLPTLLPLLEEIIKHPVFPEHEMQVYLQRDRQHFIINSQKVKYLARRKFFEVIFGASHPYGRMMTLEKYEQIDRQLIADFHQYHYFAQNCRMIVSGKVGNNLVALMNQYFGGNDWSADNTIIANACPIQPNPEHHYQISKPDALQSAIRMGKPWVTRLHPDFAGLQFLVTLFGGYFGSRLMTNIREDKGYTYDINAMAISHLQAGYFCISSEVGTEVADKAVEEIKLELHKLQDEKVKKKELNLVRNYLLGSFLRGIDGPFELGLRFRRVMELDMDMDYYNRYLDTIKSVTAQQLQDLAQQYLNEEEMWLVVAGK